jgi:hypothetical protein
MASPTPQRELSGLTPERWRAIAGPCPLNDAGMHAMETALRRGEEAGSVLVFPDTHKALGQHEVAMAIAQALNCGQRALLASGPWQLGPTLGDPYIGRAIASLPSNLAPGVVVGGFHHAHALTELALRSSTVDAYVAPPITESLAATDGRGYAHAAFRAMELLGSGEEQLLRTPRHSHIGYSRPAGERRPVTLPARAEVRPRTLHAGEAHGPLLAGNLLPMSFALERWGDVLDGAILAVEIAGAQVRMIDRYMQRLALIGAFDRIGALLVSVPFDLVQEDPSLDLDQVILRAVGRSSCIVVADAFVGCGVPATYLKLTAATTVCADPAGLTIVPSHEDCSAPAE